MRALFHALCAALVLPYLGLAALFLFIAEAAEVEGFVGFLDLLLGHAVWLLEWGVIVFLLLVGLVVMGFVARLRRAGALCLCLLATLSVVVILGLQSSGPGLGEIIFLLPCIAVAAVNGWLFVRSGTHPDALAVKGNPHGTPSSH